MKPHQIIRRLLFGLWICLVLAALGLFVSDPEAFTAMNIAAAIARFHGWVWLAYFVISALRGFTLLPSTPVVLAGVVLFPAQPFSVLFVSMFGIILSSTMIYYFSEFLGFDEYFERRKPEIIHKIKARLEQPLGILFVALWAFFPAVPTDLVCYLAGTTRMNYWKFIPAVAVGEAILCSCYIFLGGSILLLFR